MILPPSGPMSVAWKVDPVALGGFLGRRDEGAETSCDDLRPCAQGEGVDSRELEEGDGRLPVLGLLAATEQVSPRVCGQQRSDVEGGRRWAGRAAGLFRRWGAPASRTPSSLAVTEHASLQTPSGV